MRLSLVLAPAILAPVLTLAAPAADLHARENLCHLSSPPEICQPDATVTVEETARRAYQFYRAFVVDGDPRLMFSLIDKDYIVGSFFFLLPPSPLSRCQKTGLRKEQCVVVVVVVVNQGR